MRMTRKGQISGYGLECTGNPDTCGNSVILSTKEGHLNNCDWDDLDENDDICHFKKELI